MTGTERPGSLSASVLPGRRTSVLCHTYPTHGPILSIHSPGSNVSVSGGQTVGPVELAFARAFAAAAQKFLAECERLAGNGTPPVGAAVA